MVKRLPEHNGLMIATRSQLSSSQCLSTLKLCKYQSGQQEGLEHCSFKQVLGDHLATLRFNNDDDTLPVKGILKR